MFFKPPKQKKGILRIEEDFARIEEVVPFVSEASVVDQKSDRVGGQIKLMLTYKISQVEAIQESCYEVFVTVRTSNKIVPTILQTRHAGSVNNAEIIDRILTYKSKIENLESSENILALVSSDVTSKINNQIISSIKKRDFDSINLGLKKTRLVVKRVKEIREKRLENNLIRPQISMNKSDLELNQRNTRSQFEEKTLFRKMLSRKLAPTTFIDYKERGISSAESFAGTVKKKKKTEYINNPAIKLLNKALFENVEERKDVSDLSENHYLPVLETVTDSFVKIEVPISLPVSVLNSSQNLIVKFELLKTQKIGNGKNTTFVYDSAEKMLNANELFSKLNTPSASPSVSHAQKDNKIFFTVKQNDAVSDTVKIYKRVLSPDGDYTNYNLIDTVSVSNKVVNINYTDINNFDCIYRFIPHCKNNESHMSCHFTDVLISKNTIDRKRVSLVPSFAGNGVRITFYCYDPLVSHAQLLIKDLTSKQKNFVRTNNVAYFSEASNRQEIFIKNLTPNHIYELTTNLTLDTSDVIKSSNSVIFEYLQPKMNALTVTLDDLTDTTLSRSVDVRINISATIQKDQIGQIATLLGQLAGSYDTKDLLARRAEFDKLIAFEVTRYDLMTGESSNLGIIENNTTFSDLEQSRKFQALNVMKGHKYEYVFDALVRDPQTVVSESREMMDDITKKKYKMVPKKHHHPMKLLRGITLSKKFIDRDPKQDMQYGKLGSSYTYYFDNEVFLPNVTNVQANKEGCSVNITWESVGDPAAIDHFLLFIEYDSVRKVIGKSHSLTNYLKYTHSMSSDDVGYVHFIVLPVFSDFSMGSPVRSNELLIEESKVR